MVRFIAEIRKIGINPVVDPPNKVLEAIFNQARRSKSPIPIRGKLNRVEFKQTLVKFCGSWRLYINAAMLRDSGLQVGDHAQIEIEFDPRPRAVDTPAAFERALAENEKAKAEFEKLTPSRRKEVLNYLNSLKTERSIQKNTEKLMRHLLGEQTDAKTPPIGRK